jgi:muramidase (phage lysozyme)
MAFPGLSKTVSFRQLMSVPVQQRVTLARSYRASETFGDMSPTEIARLFPTYYKKKYPEVGGLSTSGATSGYQPSGGRGARGGNSASPAGTGGGSGGNSEPSAPPGPPPPKNSVEHILRKYGPKTVDDPGQRGVLGNAVNKTLSPKKRALLDAIATDSGGGYGTVNYVARGNGTKDVTDLSKGHPFIRPDGSAIKGSTAAGRYQILATNYVKFAKIAGVVDPITGVPDFSPSAQDLVAYEMAKDVYRVGTGGRNLEEDIANPNMNADSLIRPLSIDYGWHILQTGNGLNRAKNVFDQNKRQYEIEAEADEIGKLDGAASPVDGQSNPNETGINPINSEETQVIPDRSNWSPELAAAFDGANDTDREILLKIIKEQGVEKVNEAQKEFDGMSSHGQITGIVKDSLMANYEDLRQSYPEAVGRDSDIWGKIDPVFGKNLNHNRSNRSLSTGILDWDTDQISRETLIAADAAAKVLRKYGYTPRVAAGGGGNNHSKNHGENRDMNYAVDMSAYDSKGNALTLDQLPKEVRQEMYQAARLTAKGDTGMALGYSMKETSAHLQAGDPERGMEFWGYSRGPGSSKSASLYNTQEGQEFLSQMDEIKKMGPSERADRLDTLTGTVREEQKKQEKIESSTDTVQPLPSAPPAPEPQPANDTTITNVNRDAEGNQNTQPAPAATPEPEVLPAMAAGGHIPDARDPLTITNTVTGEPLAHINENEEIRRDATGVSVVSKEKVDATKLSSDYTVPTQGPEVHSEPTQETNTENPQEAPKMQNTGGMVSSVARPSLNVTEDMSNIYASTQPSPSFHRAVNQSRFHDQHFSRGTDLVT